MASNPIIYPLKKQLLSGIVFLVLSFFLLGWGSTGHYKINMAAGLSFNDEMAQFNSWLSTLAAHASDADYRKSNDPYEGPKHYIDIDNYAEFLSDGRIAQTLDSAIAIHGSSFVYNNGILPWATLASFDSLKSCFERRDWDKGVLFAADLGHYVADGHMPLHVTRNYDGQYTGNNGIHSRYESTMINAYISEFNYEGQAATEIEDVRQYIFDYIYTSNGLVDDVLAADDFAKTVNSSTSSTAYKTALWEQTKDFTIPLFSGASHALSELIYTAWLQAGSPVILTDAVFTREGSSIFSIEKIAPNPISHSARINFKLHKATRIQLQVLTISGQVIETLEKGHKAKGNYSIEWQPVNIQSGVYFIVLKSDQYLDIERIVVEK